MSRNLISLALTVGLGVFGLARGAAAASSIDLVWETSGSPTITVSSTVDTTLTAFVVVTADAAGVKALSVSFEFDADLGDELDWLGGFPTGGKEFSGVKCGAGCGPFSPTLPGFTVDTIESTNSQAGLIGNFDQVTTGGALISNTKTMGTIVFTTNALNVADDGIDVQLVILNNGIDGVIGSNNLPLTNVLFGGLVVKTPEPSSALLALAGAAALGLLRLRRRRS